MALTVRKAASLAVPDSMFPYVHKVLQVRRETADTFSLDLARTDGTDVPPFLPGQFNMLYIFGIGEVPISISSDPANHASLVHTTRAVGTVTRVIARLKVGDQIGIRGPYGTSWPVEAGRNKDIVIVAGGIGLAPLRPAMYRILAERAHFGKVVLLYGARSPTDVLYKRLLEQWRAHFDLDVFVTVDRATDSWRGSVGVVTKLISRAPFDPANTLAMVCGPEVMMRFTTLELERRGVATDHIYLSMERNMKCAVGLCGHCQYGPIFACKDGPVFRYDQIQRLLNKWEL